MVGVAKTVQSKMGSVLMDANQPVRQLDFFSHFSLL